MLLLKNLVLFNSLALKENSPVLLKLLYFLVLDLYISLSGDPICFKFGSFFPSGFILPNGKEKRKKNLKYFRSRDQKSKLAKKRKISFFLCSDQNRTGKQEWKYDKIWSKIPLTYTFANIKEKNLYILKFCESNGFAKLAKKASFLLYNDKLKNKLSGIADIN